MSSIFSGQFGTFGGGFLMGPPGAQTGADYASGGVGWGGGYSHGQSGPAGLPTLDYSGVGGGFIQNPMAQAPMVREVPVAQGMVVYAMTTPPSKPRQPGRKAPDYPTDRAWRSGWPFGFPVDPLLEKGPVEFPVGPSYPVTGIHSQKTYK